jgi:hypothetical protein
MFGMEMLSVKKAFGMFGAAGCGRHSICHLALVPLLAVVAVVNFGVSFCILLNYMGPLPTKIVHTID